MLAEARAHSRMTGCVYALVDPRTRERRYVGYTTKALTVRLEQHFRDVRNYTYNPGKREWFEELAVEGLSPVIEVLEETGDKTAEHRWILKLRREHESRLLNAAPGYRPDGLAGPMVMLRPDQGQRLKELAARENRTLTGQTREAIDRYLAQLDATPSRA